MSKAKNPMRKKAAKPLITIRKGARRWENPDRVKRWHKELEGLGFIAGPHITVTPLANWPARLFLQEKDRGYGILYDDAQSTWIDLFSIQANGAGKYFSVTNSNGPLLGLVAQRPGYFASVQYANVSPTVLYEEFKRNRPNGPCEKVSEDKVAEAYRIVCEADGRWQVEHVKDKPDADEAMQKVVRASYDRARAIVEKDELQALRRLLKNLALSEDANPHPPVTLTAAVGDGNMEAVKMFLENGANIEERTGYRSPLIHAASTGQLEIARFLLQKGARASVPEDLFGGPITSAAEHGHVEIVKLLLDLASAKEKKHALEAAKSAQHDEIVTLLGGKPKPPKGGAESRKTSKALEDLFSGFGASTLLMGEEPKDKPLEGEQRKEGIQRALGLIEKKSIKERLGEPVEDEPDTTLELAVSTGCLPLVEAVLAAKLPQEHLSGALIAAAENGFLEISKALLAAGADPKYKGYIGWTALISAVKWGRPDLVELLLDAGADPKARTEGGETPKTSVCGPFFKQISDMLLKATVAKGAAKKQAPGSSVKYLKARKAKPADGRLGAAGFRAFVGHPEWALAFVQSDPASVCKALAQAYPRWTREAGLTERTLELELPCLVVFRVKGQPWTILVRSVGWLDMDQIEGLASDATKLSRKMNTRVVTYLSEDTSGCEGYEIYEKGKKVEEATRGADTFKSSLRKTLPGTWEEFPEPSFREMGIYVPCCALDDDGYETKLVISGLPEGSVESMDAFLIQ